MYGPQRDQSMKSIIDISQQQSMPINWLILKIDDESMMEIVTFNMIAFDCHRLSSTVTLSCLLACTLRDVDDN